MKTVETFWETMHASARRGASTYSRDHVDLRVVADSVLILAAADGRGTSEARRGHLGARWAVEELMRCAAPFARHVAEIEYDDERWPTLVDQGERLGGEVCRSWRERARMHEANGPCDGMLREAAPVDPASLAHYGSSVLGAVLSRRLLFCWQLGGGEISLAGEHGIRVLFDERPRARVPDQLGTARPGRLMRFHWQPADALGRQRLVVLNTDGFSRSFADRPAYRGFVEGLYARSVRQDAQTIRDRLDGWLERAAGRSGDDASLVAAYVDC